MNKKKKRGLYRLKVLKDGSTLISLDSCQKDSLPLSFLQDCSFHEVWTERPPKQEAVNPYILAYQRKFNFVPKPSSKT
jgi:hypothetical protein